MDNRNKFKHLKKFNENISEDRERELMLIPIKSCFLKYGCKKEVEDFLVDKIEMDSYESSDEIFEYLEELNTNDLESLYLKLFN